MGSLKSGYKIGDFGAKIEDWLKIDNGLGKLLTSYRNKTMAGDICIESFVQLKLNGKNGLVTFTVTEELK